MPPRSGSSATSVAGNSQRWSPEDRRLSRELFAQKVAGTVPVTDAELVLVDAHVRAVLRALGVHSRLEAVALARRRALAK
jgi:hypothetical protein